MKSRLNCPILRTAAWLLGALVAGAALAQVRDPAALPAHDAHDDMVIAADPVTDAARSKQLFGKKHPHEAGLVAIELILRNDKSQAVRVNLEEIRLILEPRGGDRQRLRPLSLDEVVAAIVYKELPNPTARRKRLPGRLPLPGEKKEKEYAQVEAAINARMIEADVVPPRGTIRGMMFFDLGHRFELLRSARLLIPDLTVVPTGQALIFFELDLSKAVP